MAAKIQKCKRHTKDYRVSLLSVSLIKTELTHKANPLPKVFSKHPQKVHFILKILIIITLNLTEASEKKI